MGKPAIFWDRDDTLIADPGYLDDPDKVELLPGAADAVKRFAEAGFENIIVTNQSGIARGLFTEATLGKIHDRLREMFTRSGATIDAIYYCPYLPGEEAGRRAIPPGERSAQAQARDAVAGVAGTQDRSSGLLVDRQLDPRRPSRGGPPARGRWWFVRTESPEADGKELGRNPAVDFVVDSLDAAVAVVLKHTPGAGQPANGGKSKSAGFEEVVNSLNEILSFMKVVGPARPARGFFRCRGWPATIVQIAALAAFLWSIFAWIFMPEDLLGNHFMRLMLAVFLQVFALTLFVISSRPR